MSIAKVSKTYGLHSIELFARNLKYTEVQKPIEFCIDHGKIYTMKNDPYNIDRHLKSQYLINDGIRLRIYQSHNHSNGIGFIINPSTLLSGEYQPVRLWVPTEEAVNKLLKDFDKILKSLGLDNVKAKDLSLSQMDITHNEWGDMVILLRRSSVCFGKALFLRISRYTIIRTKL